MHDLDHKKERERMAEQNWIYTKNKHKKDVKQEEAEYLKRAVK